MYLSAVNHEKSEVEIQTLFIWLGDTLMIDFPNEKVPMYLWENVAAVEGAVEALEKLRKEANCHVATNANDFNKVYIQKALIFLG